MQIRQMFGRLKASLPTLNVEGALLLWGAPFTRNRRASTITVEWNF